MKFNSFSSTFSSFLMQFQRDFLSLVTRALWDRRNGNLWDDEKISLNRKSFFFSAIFFFLEMKLNLREDEKSVVLALAKDE